MTLKLGAFEKHIKNTWKVLKSDVGEKWGKLFGAFV
jgi:hypothetical protein